ncbi:MAG: Ig-like domain-containing protein, partial [Candidatus Woesearchaeota archaeon]|nr:Ig-like domain-containing protein [Candidatus Woesearchaeota archaeon]
MGKKSRVSGILILLLCSILLCSIYAFCVSGASILLTEVVSKDSNLDSKEPAFDISSGGVIHAVWVDETDLSDLSAGIASSDLSLSRNNGPDKDIFFNYRLNNTWSIQKLGSDSKMSGGVQVLSNESITSSIQPAIAFGPDNASHIVWSALSPPAELAADSNTLLLAHFNDANSLQNADYAAGAATVYSLGTEPANTKITKNALIKNALSLSGRGSSSYMNFSAVGNLDNTRGTIELWFNPLVDIQRKSSSDASVLLDLFNSTNASRGAALTLGGYNQNLITFSSYAAAYPTSASSSYSVSPSSYFYPFRANEWHHVAVTYDLSTLSASVFKLYIDGYLAGSSTQNLDRGFSFDTLCIGPCRPDQSFAADYRIDELMISDNVRSAAEIKMHAGNRSIFYRSVMNNTVESGQIMLTSGINLSYYPSITVDRSNNVHVVYNDVHNSTSLSVMYMVRNSTSWSEPELVSNGTSYAYMPDLSVDLNKTVHVVWEEFSPDDLNMSYIHHEQKNFSGTWHGEENVSDASYSSFAAHDVLGRTTLSSYFPKKPKIVTGSSNITKIVWVDNINYPDPDLLFYASFDKSTNATFSRGSGIVEQSAVSFKNSSRGSSYNKDFFYNGRSVDMANESPDISLSAHLNYSSASNLNINRGAISMWVRPFFNPSGADNTSNYLFASNYPDNLSSSLHLLISSGFGYLGSNYVQTAAVDNQTNPFAAAASVNVWAAGEWKHIGFSWDFNNETGSRELQLYMDGASMNISAQYPDNFIGPVRMNDPYGRFSIGTIFNATLGYINQTNGTIDELKIYNDTRTEAQFFGDMINDYDIFYREKNGSQWSDIIMVSNESDYMSLNPSITESGGKTYISWSQAQSDCDLNSQSFTNCAFFRIVAAMYNGTMNQLGAINDESMGGAFNPDITSSSGSIFYIWEDNSGLSGADTDIYFKKTASSAKPHVSVSEDIAGKVFTVEDPDAGLDVALAASASDVDSTVSNVTFYYTADSINGDKACTAYSDPYTCDWNIQGIAEDYYRIKAVVTSDDGGQDSDISDNYVYLDTTSGINTYFLNSSNEDNAVYIDNGVLGSIGEGNCENDLSGLDGKYCSVSSPPFCEQGDYVNSLLSVFYLNESLSTIKSIDVYWKGRGYPATSYLTNLSVWSFAESKWIPVAYKDFTSDQDDILRYTITDNIKDYLQPQNNSIYILVETQDSHRLNSCPIPATVEIGSPCPFYQSWNGEEYIFETEGLLGLFSKQSESSTYDKLSHVKE